ncbi:helix-turn-helix domain-containing protein [Aequorivita sediminis]|uniref:helix-turn-helix domain-containing protein n=1 Tax=Aequorivita sediminis TaxID=3073653 RepID=UPI0028B23708|nr:helix-turn-helix transcriptional regulator [Aequorivita sp. F6058]
MVNSKDFVKRLEKILEYYGISATAFAEKMDFNRSTISHLLSGRNKPSLDFVMKLLKEFPEVEMNWLLYGKGSFPSTLENFKDIEVEKSKPSKSSEKNLDLFSTTTSNDEKKGVSSLKRVEQNLDSGKEIDKIVIFYSDGTFKAYQN